MPPEATPTTQRAQLDNLFAVLGVNDFAAGLAAVNNFTTAQNEWNTQRQALFTAFGGTGDVPEHYDFAAGIAALRADQQALFTALGVNSQADAITALSNLNSQVNSLRANQTTIFAALGATDLAGAMRAIKDIDGRIEAGVQAGIIARAAAPGLPTPVNKPADTTTPQGAGAKSITRAQWSQMNAKQQLEFSQSGGVVTAAE